MNNKSKQTLIFCGCMAMAIALYNYLPSHVETKVADYVESSDPVDFDRLGTKIFAPERPTKLSDDEALERYLTPHN